MNSLSPPWPSTIGTSRGGVVDNFTPASSIENARLASDKPGDVNESAVSRFFKKQFPDAGRKGYVAACVSKRIGGLLALGNGNL